MDVPGAPVSVEVCTGIADHDEPVISLWPSPNDGRFTVVGAGLHGSVNLQVIGLDGRLVHEQRMVMRSGTPVQVELPGSTAPGVFTVRVLAEDAQAAVRIVVE